MEFREERYDKDRWIFNDEFKPVHEFVIELLKKQTIPLKEIRFGFSSHYCKIDCKKGIKIFWRYNKNRMNFPKLVFKIKDFEIESDQGSWEKIIIKQKEIEVEARCGAMYFVFTKPIVRLFKNKLRTAMMEEK